MTLCWISIDGNREVREALLAEVTQNQIDAVVASDPSGLTELPPGVTRVLDAREGIPDHAELTADVLLVHAGKCLTPEGASSIDAVPESVERCLYVEITDPASLELACKAAQSGHWCLLQFNEPTKIPLEIVLAAANDARGRIITQAVDLDEAEIIASVLERGSDGVLLSVSKVGDVSSLRSRTAKRSPNLGLVELRVTEIVDAGVGDRACIDTCSLLDEDEGILIGSRANGMVLSCSETHPLPYMPTRPFRVNAGALHSYTLGRDGRTTYLSELRAGHLVLAVAATGRTREVTVGRVKIERRPLLAINAQSVAGRDVNLIAQHDWHVRVLGSEGKVLNTTDLRAGDTILGHVPDQARHVGYPIEEFCLEQ